MSKYLHNIEEISRLSMTERLKLWKQERADKARQETESSSGEKELSTGVFIQYRVSLTKLQNQ